MHQAADLVAIFVTLLLTGIELSVGFFVHPVLSRISDTAHAEAAKPLAQVFGKVMPFVYAAALLSVVVSLLVRTFGTWSWWGCLSVAVLLAATIPFSLICLVPINNRVAAWSLNALPSGWKDDRRQWDRYHAIRLLILIIASLTLLAATLSTPRA